MNFFRTLSSGSGPVLETSRKSNRGNQGKNGDRSRMMLILKLVSPWVNCFRKLAFSSEETCYRIRGVFSQHGFFRGRKSDFTSVAHCVSKNWHRNNFYLFSSLGLLQETIHKQGCVWRDPTVLAIRIASPLEKRPKYLENVVLTEVKRIIFLVFRTYTTFAIQQCHWIEKSRWENTIW